MQKLTSNISLIDMSQIEFDVWRIHSTKEYAISKVKAGQWSESEAAQKAEETFSSLLPKQRLTEGYYFYNIAENTINKNIGYLWVYFQKHHSYIYDFEICPEFRRQGFGKSALLELERLVKKQNVTSIGLNVFAYNQGAANLYKQVGFAPVAIQMKKDL